MHTLFRLLSTNPCYVGFCDLQKVSLTFHVVTMLVINTTTHLNEYV